MISFRQVEGGESPDIEVSTDDADAEMADIEEALRDGQFEESTTWINFFGCAERNEEENFVFVITGGEAADIAGFYEPLDAFIEEVAQKAEASQ